MRRDGRRIRARVKIVLFSQDAGIVTVPSIRYDECPLPHGGSCIAQNISNPPCLGEALRRAPSRKI